LEESQQQRISCNGGIQRHPKHQQEHYRPDLVLFVSGIPLCIIECKRPDRKEPLSQAISQQLRSQQADGIRGLYVYAQLLLSISCNVLWMLPTPGRKSSGRNGRNSAHRPAKANPNWDEFASKNLQPLGRIFGKIWVCRHAVFWLPFG